MSDQATTGQPAEGLDKSTSTTIDPDQMKGFDQAPVDDRGQLIESFISPRTFALQEWIVANIVPRGKGTKVALGRVVGIAVACMRQPGKGEYPSYVELRGQFQATNDQTGEVNTAPVLILPSAAGNLLEAAFRDGAERAILDLEIGVEATGKSIPYRWTVRAYQQERTAMAQLVDQLAARSTLRAARRAQAQLSPPTERPMAPVQTAQEQAQPEPAVTTGNARKRA